MEANEALKLRGTEDERLISGEYWAEEGWKLAETVCLRQNE